MLDVEPVEDKVAGSTPELVDSKLPAVSAGSVPVEDAVSPISAAGSGMVDNDGSVLDSVIAGSVSKPGIDELIPALAIAGSAIAGSAIAGSDIAATAGSSLLPLLDDVCGASLDPPQPPTSRPQPRNPNTIIRFAWYITNESSRHWNFLHSMSLAGRENLFFVPTGRKRVRRGILAAGNWPTHIMLESLCNRRQSRPTQYTRQ
ncbi:MAG: hypothetical protein O3B13_15570 [Planctomycetota bacterium]|nr:hypothetical protein [Planctomycetota bacterium]